LFILFFIFKFVFDLFDKFFVLLSSPPLLNNADFNVKALNKGTDLVVDLIRKSAERLRSFDRMLFLTIAPTDFELKKKISRKLEDIQNKLKILHANVNHSKLEKRIFEQKRQTG